MQSQYSGQDVKWSLILVCKRSQKQKIKRRVDLEPAP